MMAIAPTPEEARLLRRVADQIKVYAVTSIYICVVLTLILVAILVHD